MVKRRGSCCHNVDAAAWHALNFIWFCKNLISTRNSCQRVATTTATSTLGSNFSMLCRRSDWKMKWMSQELSDWASEWVSKWLTDWLADLTWLTSYSLLREFCILFELLPSLRLRCWFFAVVVAFLPVTGCQSQRERQRDSQSPMFPHQKTSSRRCCCCCCAHLGARPLHILRRCDCTWQ